MKLLHTSDWHLGQTLNQYDRSFEHDQFLSWLLDTLESEQIDALLIAGDVFDNANPSASSQRQLYTFLTQARVRVPSLNIVMTAGNHDSPGRMEAPAPFLGLLDAHVVGHTRKQGDIVDLSRIVVPLKNGAGETAAWCIAMPFLRPGDLPRVEGAADAYLAGIEVIYAQAYAFANDKREPEQAIIALGHCHITGGKISADSERRIVIGGVESLSVRVFDPGIAYVALGHLHLAQTIDGDETRRYCGSPLPMSFSEIDYKHQVVVIELDGDKVTTTRAVKIPRTVAMLKVPKRPAPLTEALAELHALSVTDHLTAGLSAEFGPEQWPFLQVRVQVSQPEPTLRAQVEAALAGKPVRLVRIETTSINVGNNLPAPEVSVDELSRLDPADYFERLYLHRYGEQVPPAIKTAFGELLDAATQEGLPT